MIDIIPPCEVKGIHHIGIAVSDINLAAQYYQTTFNIKEAPTLENHEFSVLRLRYDIYKKAHHISQVPIGFACIKNP